MYVAFTQIVTLVKKDLLILRRKKISFFFEIVLPILMLWMVLASTSNIISSDNKGPQDGSFVIESQEPGKFVEIHFSQLSPPYLYAPNSSKIKELVDTLERSKIFTGFKSEKDLQDYMYSKYGNYTEFVPFVIFNPSTNKDTPLVDFTFGVLSHSTEQPELTDSEQFITAFKAHLIEFQSIVQRAVTNTTRNSLKLWAYQSGRGTFSPNALVLTSLSFAFTIANIVSMAFLVSRIIGEKKKGSKEFLRMVGVSDACFYLSHGITTTILMVTQIASGIYLLYYKYSFSFVTRVSPLYLLVALIFLTINSIAFSCALCTLFNQAALVDVLLIIIWSFSQKPSVDSVTLNALICIISPYYTFNHLLRALYSTSSIFSLHTTLLIMFCSIIFFIIFTIYMDAVCPWQPGTPKPFYYPLGVFGKKTYTQKGRLEEGLNEESHLFEPVAGGEAKIVCTMLNKSFGWFGSKYAVSDLNLSIHQGELTILLGHNGAGKTTLMNMITGFTLPSSGCVFVNGYNVAKQTNKARRSIALCPQHNVQFELLTVKENLQLMLNLRGVKSLEANEKIKATLNSLNMPEKSNTVAKNLSGGQLRRLQLGLAIVSNSETLILDEPTSGLDPETRRKVWDYLLSLRRSHTILMTTHSMEEADALADRIVIMSSGSIKCSGSTMFLKNKLGAGYSIRLFKTNKFNPDAAATLFSNLFPQATVVSETNDDITYSLNTDEKMQKSPKFSQILADLCDKLDSSLNSIGIKSYGINNTSLEDVFLKVAVSEGLLSDKGLSFNQVKSMDFESMSQLWNYEKNKESFIRTLHGLLAKRFRANLRDILDITCSIILPIIIPLVLICLADLNKSLDQLIVKDFTEYRITSSMYDSFPAKVFMNVQDERMKNCLRSILQFPADKIIEYNGTLHDYVKDQDVDKLSELFLMGFQIATSNDTDLFYGEKYTFSLPLALNVYHNALECYGDPTRTNAFRLEYQSPPAKSPISSFLYGFYNSLFLILVSILISLAFMMPSFSLFPAAEHEIKASLVQKMAGLGDIIYWFGNFIYDFTKVIFIGIVLMIEFNFLFEQSALSSEAYCALFLLFLTSGCGSILYAYLIVLTGLKPNACFKLQDYFYNIVGIVLLVSFMAYTDTILSDLFEFSRAVYFFPLFSFCTGFMKILSSFTVRSVCPKIKEDLKSIRYFGNDSVWTNCINGIEPSAFQLIRNEIIATFICFFAALIILLCYETYWTQFNSLINYVQKVLSRGRQYSSVVIKDDEDVIEEKENVARLVKQSEIAQEALIVHQLTKDFYRICGKAFRAVNDISFTVHKKECFGMLGVNGAGKTTTFSMLTGDIAITHGNAYLSNISIRENVKKYRKMVSYCPQYDALIGTLTPVETLSLFARIIGMPENDLRKNVNFLLEVTDLSRFRTTLAKNLSGGNKRKLSLAIAAITRPSILFLDEPTTGVDPASRRKIWATLVGIRESGHSSLVLTSHSMDECEALCNRIGILSAGQFVCLGSPHHLKTKFGQGFSMTVKLRPNSSDSEIKNFIGQSFPTAKLRDSHATVLSYLLPDPSLKWSFMFRTMGTAQKNLPIEYFYICDTDIEQIFLSFAKSSNSPKK